MVNNKREILKVLTLLFAGAFYFSACQNATNNSFEDSIEPYMELQAVDGASNVTATVNRGEALGFDSYFAIDFTNFDSNGLVPEGLSEGWCLDYSKPIEQNNDVHTGIKMYNTFGSDNWKPANYLMNIKDELKKNDPSLTYKEIQVALWSLIEVPAFNMDKALREGTMPSRMMSNGTPNFSIEKTKGIVSKVRAEVNDFVYKPGTPVIVYSNVSEDKQPMAGVFGESAWGFTPDDVGNVDDDKSIEFCGNSYDGKMMPNKWGWTNRPIADGSSGSLDLYAGAGQCNINSGTFVGTFEYTYNNGVLDYTLTLTVDNDFKDLHIHAGQTALPLKNGGGPAKFNGAPGQFDYGQSISSGVGETEGSIENLSGSIYLAVHLGG